MRPYFQKEYPSFNHRLFALHPHYNELTPTQRIAALATTSLQHFYQEYSLRILALILAFLALFLALTILFSSSSWLSDETLVLLLIATTIALLYTLLKLFGSHQRTSPQNYEMDPVTLFNFKSRFSPKPGANQNHSPFSKYNFQYQQEAFEVPSYNRKLMLPHMREHEAIDFRRGKGKVDLGVVHFNPSFKDPPKQALDFARAEIPRLGEKLRPVNYEVEIEKFIGFIEKKGMKLKTFQFEGASVFFWMKEELIPLALNLKMKLDSKSSEFMDRVGYKFVWTKSHPKKPADLPFGGYSQKVFTVEEARALRDALREDSFEVNWMEASNLLSDVKQIMEELPQHIRASFKKETLAGLTEFLAIAKVFCVIDFDSALTRPYVFDRLAALKTTSFQDVKNNSGGECAAASWNSNFPTDSQILMHVFSQFAETQKFQRFRENSDVRKQLYKNYRDLHRGEGAGSSEGSQLLGLLKRFEEKNKEGSTAISIYSKSDSAYEPHYEVVHQNITYPSLPGLYSAFTAIGWFLKLAKRMKNSYNGADFTKISQEVLCLDNDN